MNQRTPNFVPAQANKRLQTGPAPGSVMLQPPAALTVNGQPHTVRERRVERRVFGGAAHDLAVVRLAHGQRQPRDGHPRAGVGCHAVVLLRVAVPVEMLNRLFRR